MFYRGIIFYKTQKNNMSRIFNLKNKIKQNHFLFNILNPLYRIYIYVIHTYRRNKTFIKNGEKVLLQAKYALDSIELHFWLEFGTLLGAYRDNTFIKSDLDIDLGLFLKDYSPNIKKGNGKLWI